MPFFSLMSFQTPMIFFLLWNTADVTLLYIHHWQWRIFTWHVNIPDDNTPQMRFTGCRRKFSQNNALNECLFLTQSITSAPEDQHDRVTDYMEPLKEHSDGKKCQCFCVVSQMFAKLCVRSQRTQKICKVSRGNVNILRANAKALSHHYSSIAMSLQGLRRLHLLKMSKRNTRFTTCNISHSLTSLIWPLELQTAIGGVLHQYLL